MSLITFPGCDPQVADGAQPEPDPEPVVDVVEICEKLLADARSGRVRAVAVAAVLDTGGFSTTFAGYDAAHLLLAAAASHLSYRIHRAMEDL